MVLAAVSDMHSPFSICANLVKRGIFDPFMILNVLEIRTLLRDCPRVLDVGCGLASPLQYLGLQGSVGIDGYEPAIASARRASTHSEFVVGDIRQLPTVFREKQFDACIALDVIEHLPKDDGFQLIRSMESVAKKRIIFLTPNGFLPQRHQERDDLQEHLSGWTASEMKEMGFSVLGMLGPKSLRGEFHVLKRRPRPFWALYSLMKQLTFTRQHPESAAAILCYKDL